MAVYVDDFLFPADIPSGRVVHSSNWSHLFNDGPDKELHEFAQRLGLKREYFQHPGEWHRHYDVTQGKRWQAIRVGAKEVTSHEGTKILRDRAERARLDYDAGAAFRAGDLDRARAILAKALIEHPDHAEHWTARLERVSATAPVTPESVEPSPLPPVGVHRENGSPTTLSRFGTFERAPDPGPEHHCPGCTTEIERDERVIRHGPRIEQHQDVCQGCQVDADTRARPAAVHDEKPVDRSDPAKDCAKCGAAGVGPGGIVCPRCCEEIEARISPGKERAVTPQPGRNEAEAGQ